MGILDDAGVKLIWFDSLGAKSSCIEVVSSSGSVVIDPGAAIMQPSYPLSFEEKLELREAAINAIEDRVINAKAIIITHYHYDHHVLPTDIDLSTSKLYEGKLLILKNPNMYINESQWGRARMFLSEVLDELGDSLNNHLSDPEISEFKDPVEGLIKAMSIDYGDYSGRKKELLKKGKKWFDKLVSKLWSKEPWVNEMELKDGTKIVWGDGKMFEFGDTIIEVLEPWFHGIEYDRTGWVTSIIIRKGNYTIFYSSDLMGPVIEDYTDYIAKVRPDALILDGPPTYLFPYMLNRINLRRSIDNVIMLINSGIKLIVYDHHLLRERRWRKRVEEVFKEASKNDVALMTAAEYLGKQPLIDTL